MKKIYLVIAGDRRQYETWRYFYKGLKDYGSSRFIENIDQLRSYAKPQAEIVLYGEYWKNKAYNDERYQDLSDRLVVIKPDN